MEHTLCIHTQDDGGTSGNKADTNDKTDETELDMTHKRPKTTKLKQEVLNDPLRTCKLDGERENINIEMRGTQWEIEKGINKLSTKTENQRHEIQQKELI